MMTVKEQIILTLVKTVRKTLFRVIAIGVNTVTARERHWAQLRMQRWVGTYRQGPG